MGKQTGKVTTGRARREAAQAAREAQARRVRRRRNLAIAGYAGALLLIVGIVAAVLFSRIHTTATTTAAATTVPVASVAGEIAVPDEGRGHVDEGSVIPYKAHPPASGIHYPNPAAAGFYTKPVAEGTFVHNLEHGYVVILYKSGVDAPTQEQLRQAMTNFPAAKYGKVKMIIAPYEQMDTPITAVAWDWSLPLPAFDREALLSFYRTHVDHGPEDVP